MLAGFDAGACMGIPAMTAHRCVMADGAVAGKTVLVQGGAGAVGYYAVQIARLEGARVIATVSRPEQAERAREAGAHEVIDRRTEDVAARVRAITGADAGLDRVIEVAFGSRTCDGDVAACQARLAQGGWGTTTIGGDEPIPTRNVSIIDNVLLNPDGSASQWQQFFVPCIDFAAHAE
jgi:NADPH:quinone reductase-like Zn-dependent oxidoreductase